MNGYLEVINILDLLMVDDIELVRMIFVTGEKQKYGLNKVFLFFKKLIMIEKEKWNLHYWYADMIFDWNENIINNIPEWIDYFIFHLENDDWSYDLLVTKETVQEHEWIVYISPDYDGSSYIHDCDIALDMSSITYRTKNQKNLSWYVYTNYY